MARCVDDARGVGVGRSAKTITFGVDLEQANKQCSPATKRKQMEYDQAAREQARLRVEYLVAKWLADPKPGVA